MRRNLRHFLTAVFAMTAILFMAAPGKAQDSHSFYTYIGPYLGVGYNLISYQEWDRISNTQATINANGPHGVAGVTLQLYMNEIIGDFKVGYMYNMNDGDHSAYHLQCAISLKYMWQLENGMHLGTGLGIYTETPPSTGGYDGGAGFILPVCAVFNISETTKAFTELEFRLGSYGNSSDMAAGESRKIALGLQAGFLFRIGKV